MVSGGCWQSGISCSNPLGPFTLVINALMLILTSWLSAGLTIEGGITTGFLTALLGSIMISIVSTVLSWFLPD